MVEGCDDHMIYRRVMSRQLENFAIPKVSEANLCSEKSCPYGKPLAWRSYRGMAKFSVVAPNRKTRDLTRFRSVVNSTPKFIMKTHENYTWTIITI